MNKNACNSFMEIFGSRVPLEKVDSLRPCPAATERKDCPVCLVRNQEPAPPLGY